MRKSYVYCLSLGGTPNLVRYHLPRLGIGADLKRIALNPKYPYRIAPVEEVLALKPDLRPPN